MKTNKYSAKSARVGTTPKHVLVKQGKAHKIYYEPDLSDIEQQHVLWLAEAYGTFDGITGAMPFTDAKTTVRGDIHAQTASRMFNVSEKDVTKAQRQAAKQQNFLSLYCISMPTATPSLTGRERSAASRPVMGMRY